MKRKMKNKRHKYTEEENEFIRKNSEGLTGRELTDLFNLRFKCSVSKGALMRYKTVRLKIKGSKNEGTFLKGNIPWNKGLKGWQKVKPKNLFKKGNLPKTTRPIGSERPNKDGFIEVKIANPGVWRLKHHVIYEKYHNVKIDRWDKVIFLDGNKRNFDINNLEKVSNSEQTYLAKYKLLGNNPEINKTALILAKLTANVKKIEKKVN